LNIGAVIYGTDFTVCFQNEGLYAAPGARDLPGRIAKAIVGLPPDFLLILLALTNSMRLSLMKAAHADVGGASRQEIRVAHLFRPMYAVANMGHPSDFLRPLL
jgi:hypothetical protein